MKYIAFWEFCPEDFDKVVDKYLKMREDREKNPDKYPEVLFPSHSTAGKTEGLQVVEATADQIMDAVLYWRPLLKLKYVPLIESAKIVEKYLKSK